MVMLVGGGGGGCQKRTQYSFENVVHFKSRPFHSFQRYSAFFQSIGTQLAMFYCGFE